MCGRRRGLVQLRRRHQAWRRRYSVVGKVLLGRVVVGAVNFSVTSADVLAKVEACGAVDVTNELLLLLAAWTGVSAGRPTVTFECVAICHHAIRRLNRNSQFAIRKWIANLRFAKNRKNRKIANGF